MTEELVVIRGGGELATGIAHRLHKIGFSILMLEKNFPSAIRRTIVFSEAIYEGEKEVERITCFKADNMDMAKKMLKEGKIVILVDPLGESISYFKPRILIDAIYAKRNMGTTRQMADFTIGIGPGFIVGQDVDCVIETTRGHDLGRILYSGQAMTEKETVEVRAMMQASRSIKAPCEGFLEQGHPLGYLVKKKEVIAILKMADGNVFEIKSPVEGILRGLLHDGCPVRTGLKIAEIDPSTQPANCSSISAKTRCISGSVLEAILLWQKENPKKKSRIPWRK